MNRYILILTGCMIAVAVIAGGYSSGKPVVPAGDISGEISDSNLSSNVALKDEEAVFTANVQVPTLTYTGSDGTNLVTKHLYTGGTNYHAGNMVGGTTTNLYPQLIEPAP